MKPKKSRVAETSAVDDNAMHNHATGTSQYAGDHDFKVSGWSERSAMEQLALVVALQGFWGLRTKEVSLVLNAVEAGGTGAWKHFLFAHEVARDIIRRNSASPDFAEYTAGLVKLAFLGYQSSDTPASEVKHSLVRCGCLQLTYSKDTSSVSRGRDCFGTSDLHETVSALAYGNVLNSLEHTYSQSDIYTTPLVATACTMVCQITWADLLLLKYTFFSCTLLLWNGILASLFPSHGPCLSQELVKTAKSMENGWQNLRVS